MSQIVQFETLAFVLPENLDDIKKRYAVDFLVLTEEGAIMGLGPNDTDWREIPADAQGEGNITTLRSVK